MAGEYLRAAYQGEAELGRWRTGIAHYMDSNLRKGVVLMEGNWSYIVRRESIDSNTDGHLEPCGDAMR